MYLTDAESEIWLRDFRISEQDNLKLEGSADWSIAKRTLQGGPSANIDVVTIDNGVLSVEVLPTRGMGFWKGTFRGKQSWLAITRTISGSSKSGQHGRPTRDRLAHGI